MVDCPENIEFRLLPGQRGQVVRWREPVFQDNVGIVRVQRTRVRAFLILRVFFAGIVCFRIPESTLITEFTRYNIWRQMRLGTMPIVDSRLT